MAGEGKPDLKLLDPATWEAQDYDALERGFQQVRGSRSCAASACRALVLKAGAWSCVARAGCREPAHRNSF